MCVCVIAVMNTYASMCCHSNFDCKDDIIIMNCCNLFVKAIAFMCSL